MVKLLNVALVTIPFLFCWFGYYAERVVLFSSLYRSAGIIILFLFLYLFFGRIYDAFMVSLKRISEMFFSQMLGIVMADGVMFLVLWLISCGFPNMLPALAALSGQLIFSALWCKYAHIWYFKHFSGQKTGVVYDVRRGMEDLFGEYGLDKKFEIQFTCSVDECLENISVLDDVEVVFLCGVHSHDRNIILKYCVEKNIYVYMIPRIGDVIMSGAKRMHMFHLPILRAGRYNPPVEYLALKRLFDVIISAFGIVLLSPIMLGVAIAIKAYDKGPVFYKQTRLTKDGKLFQVLNVRCMGIAGHSAQNPCAVAV